MTRGNGECLLSPVLPGSIEMLDVGAAQYILSDGSFLAAEASVELRVRTQGIGAALCGDAGGVVVMETGGHGKIAVSGFGAMFVKDLTPERGVTIDNAHAVAWDSRLRYEVSMSPASAV